MVRRYVPFQIEEEILELIGKEATTALVREFGGLPLYVPKASKDEHRITALIGLRASSALCSAYGGTKIMVPLRANAVRHRRDMALIRRRMEGASTSETAREFGVCQRSAQRSMPVPKRSADARRALKKRRRCGSENAPQKPLKWPV